MNLPLLLLTALLPGAALAECALDRAELRGAFGAAAFTVELADDAAERSLGLMNREAMPTGAGMLFLYEHAQRVAFWMENTLIPLDMIFLDASGTVLKVHENAVPGDRTAIPGDSPEVRAVLEINGGLARAIGIAPGDHLRHAAMPQDSAVWPCAE